MLHACLGQVWCVKSLVHGISCVPFIMGILPTMPRTCSLAGNVAADRFRIMQTAVARAHAES